MSMQTKNPQDNFFRCSAAVRFMPMRMRPLANPVASLLLIGFMIAAADAMQRIESIVAFVGDSAILESELRAYVLLKMGGVADSTIDSLGMTMLRHQSLDELIDGKVLLVRAEKDTNISLTENEIDAQLELRVQAIIKQNGLTPEAFEDVLKAQQGISLSKFKAEVRKQIRQELLKQKVQAHYVTTSALSRSDIEQFYTQYKDSLPQAGESILLSEIAISVEPSAMVRQKAYDKISAMKQRLDNGQDFAEVAKRYSEGPNASMGGDLGFIAKGTLGELAFEEKVFSMQPGTISDIFQTRLGFHVVEVSERRDQKVHVRQLFVAVKPPQEALQRASAQLDSVRENTKGQEGFVQAVRAFSDDKISKSRDGLLGWQELGALSPQLRSAVDTLEAGEVTRPIRSDNTLAIYRLEQRRDSRPLTLEDDWNEIASIAERIVAQQKLLDLVRKWRRDTFIDIRL